MAILDIVELFDETGELIVARMPPDGSGEFRLGSQLVVQESQTAIFYKDGKALDGFDPGRHILVTQNLPLLGGLIGFPFGGKSPFRCYVYFVATKTFINLGWGTASPVLFRDTDFRMISLRAHGMYSIRITKPRTFLNNLVGTRGMETTYAIEEFLKSIIVARLNEILGGTMKSILDLAVQYSAIAIAVKQAVAADFEQYGITLVDLIIEAITPPSDVQEMINRAGGVAVQDAGKYTAIAAADAMRDAAKNPGGSAGEGLGAGMGIGMGLGMAQQIAQNIALSRQTEDNRQPVANATNNSAKLSLGELKAKLKELKELQDEGLIGDRDFEEQKKRLLSMM